MENPESVKVSFLGRGLAVLLVLFIIPANYILQEVLRTASDDLIVSIQKLRTDFLDDFFKLVLYIGNNLTLVVVPPIIYNLYDTRRAVKQIFVNCFGMYVFSVIALLTKEPRPYWDNSRVKGISCEDGYGSPCLELFIASVLYSSYSIEIFHRRKKTYKIIPYTITAVVVILIAFGALYLGQNYPTQIFVTYCYTYVYVTIIFTFDDELMKITLKSCFNYQQNRKYSVHWFAATLFLFTGVITIYDIVTLNKPVNLIWIKNAYSDCNFSRDIGGGPSFERSAWIFYSLGMVYGCMQCSKNLSMYWWNTNYWKRFLRAIISTGISLAIFFLFSKTYTDLTPGPNTTTEYMFRDAIPYFLMAYLISGVLPIIFARYHLALPLLPDVDNEAKLMKHDETYLFGRGTLIN